MPSEGVKIATFPVAVVVSLVVLVEDVWSVVSLVDEQAHIDASNPADAVSAIRRFVMVERCNIMPFSSTSERVYAFNTALDCSSRAEKNPNMLDLHACSGFLGRCFRVTRSEPSRDSHPARS